MRHGDNIRRFGRSKSQREALIAGLAQSLVLRGSIRTTLARAKELRPFVEKLITKAVRRGVSVKTELADLLNSRKSAEMLVGKLATRYKKGNGGYTRIVKMPIRKSDASKMAVIEFVNNND